MEPNPRPALKAERILVTGAAGFIGFHLVARLVAEGAAVHGVDNLNGYYDVGLKRARLAQLRAEIGEHHPRFAFSEADVTDYAGLAALFAAFQPECVVHLAAQAGVRYSLVNPRAFASTNVDGFLSVLEAARAHPVRHLIYASSSSVYGANAKVPYHEDDPVLAPLSLYAATKRANELMAQSYAHLYGIPASGVRFFTVYGPWGRPDMAYYSFTKAILEGRPIDVFNHGAMRRDFTYIDDVVEALARLIDRPPSKGGGAAETQGEPAVSGTAGVPHTIYNIGNHTPIALNDFISTLEASLGREAERRYLPMQPGDVPATYADVGRLHRVTGFAPRTPIDAGIARFVAWYRAYYRC